MTNPFILEVEYLKNENKRLLQQVKGLNAIISKFTNEQKTLDLLLGNQKHILDKSGIGFDEYNAPSSQKSSFHE